jgi:hypothetical protein
VAAGTLVGVQALVTDLALRKSRTYHWTVTPDNGQPILHETDTTGVYQFNAAAAGNYLVTLSVTDDQMHTAGAPAVLVKAAPVVPTVTITGPTTSAPGQLLTLHGSARDDDPNQAGSGSANTYTLSWSVFTTAGTATPLAGTVSTFSFIPSVSGLAIVTLTATDQTGHATAAAAAVISVTGTTRALTVTPPANPAEGGSLAWTASVSGGTAVSYAWTVFSPDGVTKTYNTGASNALTLSGALPGRYVVDVTATLSDGSTASAAAPAAGTLVDVPNAPPAVTITVPPPPSGHTSFQEGDTITLQGTATDPGSDLGFATYLWTVSGPNHFSQVGVLPNLTFQPLAAGTYTATLKVRDLNGGTGSATATVAVIHVPPRSVLRYVNTNPDGTVSLVVQVANPASLYTFTYTGSLNGQPYLQATAGGASFNFRIPLLTGPTLASVTVTDSAGAHGSVTATVSAVAAGTASAGVSKTVTAADLLAGSDTALVLAQGYDTVTADPALPASVTVTFVAVGAHNHFIGGATVNVFQGDSGSNLLEGGTGPNTFYATGNDTALGGSGSNPNLFVPVPTAGSTGNTLSMTAGASANTIDLSQENAVSLNLNLTTAQPFDASGNSVQLSGAFQSVLGSAGANTLTASSGSSISGGGGNDLLMSNSASNVTLSASSGQASLQASGGSNILLQGGKDTNLLSTTNATNVMLVGGSGNNDSLSASGSANASLYGGTGSNDLLTRSGGGDNAYLFGQSGNNDSLISPGGGTGVSLIGGSGNGLYLSDTGSTSALLVGGSGNNDSLVSSGGQNVSLVGGSGGNDSLVTSGGNGLTVYGGYGDRDSLVASGGANVTLYGVSGNFDLLAASNGSNVTVIGGTGFDNTITDTNGSSDTLINGGNSLANLTTNGGTNINLFGGGGTDVLTANGGANVGLYGEDGDNTYNVNAAGGSSTSFTGFLDDLGTNGLEQSATDALESGTNTIAFPTATAVSIDLSQQTGGASVKIDRQAVAASISPCLVGPFTGVMGTAGSDFIRGDALPCSLVGGTGHDVYAFRGTGLGSDVITQTNANNTDAIDLSQLGGGPATLGVATTAAQAVNQYLTLALTRANIADVIGSPQGNTLTGNARDNHFTLSGGNNTVSGGGGLTTVKFTGSALGTTSSPTPPPGVMCSTSTPWARR